MRWIIPLLYTLVSFGQTNVDSTFVAEKHNRILQLRTAGDYQVAEELCDSLLSLADLQNSLKWKTQIEHAKTRVLIDLGQYDQCIALAKQVGKQYLELDQPLNKAAMDNIIGVGFYFKSELDSTLIYYNRSYTVKKELEQDPYQLAISAYNLGIVYEDQANYNPAISTYLEAMDYLKRSDEENTFLADVYVALANTYKNKNDLVKAQEFTTLALQEGLDNYGPDNPSLSFIYESNAAVYQALGDYESAKVAAKKALNLRQKYYGEVHRWTAQARVDMAEIYLNLGRKDSAYWYAKKAEQTAVQLENKLDLANAKVLLALAVEDSDAAAQSELLAEARSLFIQVYGLNHMSVADTYLQQAKLAISRNQQTAAKEAIQAVYQRAQYVPGELGSCKAPFEVLEAIGLELGTSANADQVLILIQRQIELIKYIRRFYNTPNSQLFFNGTIQDLLQQAVARCFEYATGPNDSFSKTALELMQLSTNNVLIKERDFMNSLVGEQSDSEKLELAKLNQAWAQTNQQLFYEEGAAAPNKVLIDSLLEQRVSLSRQIEEAWKALDRTEGSSADRLKAIDLTELQGRLNEGQQIVQYLIAEQYTYAISITKTDFSFNRLSNSERILQQVQDLRKAIVNRTAIDEMGQSLYQKLLQPILKKDTSELILIAQNELSFIPFGVLMDADQKYLIEKVAVNYINSFSLFGKTETMDAFEYQWQGFAVYNDQNNRLPKSLEEVRTLSQVTKGQAFLNEAATKSAVLNALRKARVVHLATHGQANSTNSMYSSLDLYSEQFTASELYAQPARAALVVLSACETAYGNLEKGEGVISFARALTISGAQSTLTTMWQVPDKETAAIMELFYENLADGQTKSNSLRNAQLSFLKNADLPELKHPFYWAAFALSGDSSALNINASKPWYLWLGGGLALLAVFGFFYRRTKAA